MKRTKFLRPQSLSRTGLDEAVKVWLRSKGFEPVDRGKHEVVLCLPYCGGGNYYHRDVSPGMALDIIDAVVKDTEFRWIKVLSTDTAWAGEPDREKDYRVLEEVDLEFDDNGYAGWPTLAIMRPPDVVEAERKIAEELLLNYHDLGVT